MRSIKEIQDFEGKKVIVRTDWNVPHTKDKILDTSRIDVTLETIRWITENGGSVIVISHFGREGESMKDATSLISEILPITFVEDPFSEQGKNQISRLKSGEVAVIENIRKWAEEENNNEAFGESLAKLGDMYVNEAFSASHRNHASMVGIPKFLPKFAGIHFLREVENLSKAFSPEHPFIFILGGAKFETKIPLVENFLNIADKIFIGGALAKQAVLTPLAQNPKIIFPKGDIAALDANPETLEMLEKEIQEAKFVLWNGPLGNYENGYNAGTKKLALVLSELKERNNAQVIIGGGDTEECVSSLGIKDKFTWVSLAGGAMLEFLAKRNLPGIEALN